MKIIQLCMAVCGILILVFGTFLFPCNAKEDNYSITSESTDNSEEITFENPNLELDSNPSLAEKTTEWTIENIIAVIQLVVNVVAIIAVFVGYKNTQKENNRQRTVDLIENNRLLEMKEIRDKASSFISIAISSNNELNYTEKLTKACYDFKNYLKPKYYIDKTIIIAIDNVYKKSLTLADKMKDKDFKSECEKIYYLISLYTYSNWECIKEQANGIQLKAIDYENQLSKNYHDCGYKSYLPGLSIKELRKNDKNRTKSKRHK